MLGDMQHNAARNNLCPCFALACSKPYGSPPACFMDQPYTPHTSCGWWAPSMAASTVQHRISQPLSFKTPAFPPPRRFSHPNVTYRPGDAQ